MTEETAHVEQLDYSKPPPGYRIAWRTHGAREWVFAVDGRDALEQFASEVDAITAAWSHAKVAADPPGVMHCGPLALYVTFGPGLPKFLSRAAAWAWYDRRLALAHTGVAWPLVLTWSDEACAAAEANNARLDRIDAVLDGKLQEEALDG